jgi:hypothetical protein
MKSRLEIAAIRALTKPDGVSAPGQCWRFCRLEIEALGLPSPGPSLDAKSAAAWYREHGLSIWHLGWLNTQPGDLLFWLDGNHGHAAVRISGNRIAENSSVHSTNGSDARGTRSIQSMRAPVVVVRFS